MELEDLRELCLQMAGVTEGYPFGEDVLVFKVMGKVFCLMSLDAVPSTVNLKCEPEKAIDLREQYDAIAPGYHMNKKHWNTLTLDGSIPSDLCAELLTHSYDRVVAGLTRAKKLELAELAELAAD